MKEKIFSASRRYVCMKEKIFFCIEKICTYEKRKILFASKRYICIYVHTYFGSLSETGHPVHIPGRCYALLSIFGGNESADNKGAGRRVQPRPSPPVVSITSREREISYYRYTHTHTHTHTHYRMPFEFLPPLSLSESTAIVSRSNNTGRSKCTTVIKARGGGARACRGRSTAFDCTRAHADFKAPEKEKKRERENAKLSVPLCAGTASPFSVSDTEVNSKQERAASFVFSFFPFFLSFFLFFFFFQAGAPSWKNTAYRGFRR